MNFKRFYFLGFLVTLTFSLTLQAQTEYPIQQVEVLMYDLLTKANLPGISISVKKENEIIYSKGFGYSDIKKKKKMKADTPIRAASVSKMITVTALGKLATEGKIDFDKPIKEYVHYTTPPYANLTVRQLAGHTSGIPHKPNKRRKKKYSNTQETYDLIQNSTVLFKPDTQYKYSTLAYNLLAAVIEGASGKTYTKYLKEDIFPSLNMNNTFPEIINDLDKNDAKSYYQKKGKLVLEKKLSDGSYKLAGAGFRSTSIDLVHMMDAYSNGFIDPKIVEIMFSSNELSNGEKTNVGIGWRINEDIQGKRTIEHAGNRQGARTVIVNYPEEKLSISIMINAKCILFIEETAHVIAQLFLESQPYKKEGTAKNYALEIKNNGAKETYKGALKMTKDHVGRLIIDKENKWYSDSKVFYISREKNYTLSTEFGLIFMELNPKPLLRGKVFIYQLLSDAHHISKMPLLEIKAL